TPEKPAPVAESVTASSKTPTPRKTPKKSPGRRRSSLATTEVKAIPEVEVQATPEKTIVEAHANLDPGTPEIVTQKDIEEVEPSPFVRRTPVSASKTN